MTAPSVTPIQLCLDRLRAGDESAREDLLKVSQQRLLALARKMLSAYPGVRRWEGSEDVLQNSLLRLDRALGKLPLASTADYLRLAAAQIRWELIDLYRHYFRVDGLGARYITPPDSSRGGLASQPIADSSQGPAGLIDWSELHERIARLPADERDAFDLLWYHDLSQTEAAGLLGVSVRTVKRRWQSARLLLAEFLENPFV